MKCASEKWKEVFVVNELSFEPLKDSCTSDRDTPIFIAKDVLKYPEQVREFMEDGYWWENAGDPEFYGNSYNGNMELYSSRSYLPHVDTFPGDDQNEDPLNDVAFNMSLTKSDKVKTAFYSFNNKKSVCDFTAKDYSDLRDITNKHEFVISKQWKESGEDEYENYKLEYVADIDYNSMILYPSHYWHNAYLKEDWFIDEDRVTFTGFFELIK